METETLSACSTDTFDLNYIGNSESFDLPALIKSMKQSYLWTKKELNALILSRDRKKQVILTSIHVGTEIESFQSKDSITFHILEGKLIFHAQGNTIILNKGQLMTITKKIKYLLTTEEDTIFLLSVANSPVEAFNN
jgi:quercetin dioxygenase-like cupin family protein